MKALEIKKMSKNERLRAMEELWDSLLRDEDEIESPQWHQDVLNARSKKIENGDAEFLSLDELRERRKS